MTGWPPMLSRIDRNGKPRPRNIVIRMPRIPCDDKALNDGSMPHAHAEAYNLCEAACGGFGPSVLAALFLPEPDPPNVDEEPRHAFRFVTVMRRQSASLEQRTKPLVQGPSRSPSVAISPHLSAATARYFHMLLNTVFEYSVRGIVFLDATRANFMDEEATFRLQVKPEELHAVDRINVIDLDPRFYRRVDISDNDHSVWLFNVVFVFAHLRRADCKRNVVPLLMHMVLDGGLTVAELVRKVYAEEKVVPRNQWLFGSRWDAIPQEWQPKFEDACMNTIRDQIKMIVGYYFFYAERDGNGKAALEMFDRARWNRDAQGVDAAKARFHSSYTAGGGMHCARHFLLATRDKSIPSVLEALMTYIDSTTLLKKPELLTDEAYAQPTPLPRMHDPLGLLDAHLGLLPRSSRKR
jgi:hypothetical protein